MMKWMIAGKLSLHDGCHYINPDHADHKDPMTGLQKTVQRVVDLFFNHPKSSITSRSTADGNKMRGDIFTPPSSGIPCPFRNPGNKNGAIWRHLKRECGRVPRRRSERPPGPASNRAGLASGTRPGPVSHVGQYPSGFFCCQFQLSAHICCRSRCARQPSISAASDGSA